MLWIQGALGTPGGLQHLFADGSVAIPRMRTIKCPSADKPYAERKEICRNKECCSMAIQNAMDEVRTRETRCPPSAPNDLKEVDRKLVMWPEERWAWVLTNSELVEYPARFASGCQCVCKEPYQEWHGINAYAEAHRENAIEADNILCCHEEAVSDHREFYEDLCPQERAVWCARGLGLQGRHTPNLACECRCCQGEVIRVWRTSFVMICCHTSNDKDQHVPRARCWCLCCEALRERDYPAHPVHEECQCQACEWWIGKAVYSRPALAHLSQCHCDYYKMRAE